MKTEISNNILKTELIDWRNLKWFQGDLKTLSKESFQKLKQSLLKNNFIQPFNVWEEKDNLWCVDGHHRLKAMQDLEKDGVAIPVKLPANFINCKDKKQAKKLVLVYSSIYAKIVDQELYNFLDGSGLNFDELKLEIDLPEIKLNKFENEFLKEENEELPVDLSAELNKKWKVKKGDLWQIGIHKLLCGDSSEKEDVESLMQGENADMCITSPPYFNQRQYSQYSDYSHYLETIRSICKNIYDVASKKSFALMWNVGSDVSNGKDIPSDHSVLIAGLGFNYKGTLCWKKSGLGSACKRSGHIVNNCMYYPNYIWEPIYIFTVGAYPKFESKDVDYVNEPLGDVWEATQEMGSSQKKIGHNALFPLAIAERAIRSMSTISKLVYEPFAGGGTVFVACEKTSRKCYGIEISPDYCAVILERMKTNYPDIKIEKINEN